MITKNFEITVGETITKRIDVSKLNLVKDNSETFLLNANFKHEYLDQLTNSIPVSSAVMEDSNGFQLTDIFLTFTNNTIKKLDGPFHRWVYDVFLEDYVRTFEINNGENTFTTEPETIRIASGIIDFKRSTSEY